MLRSITRIMMIHEYQQSNEADAEEIWRRTALLSLTEAEAIISSLKHSRDSELDLKSPDLPSGQAEIFQSSLLLIMFT
jgi:hypothetical protein